MELTRFYTPGLAQVVTGHVLAVLAELDRLAEVWAAMHSRQESLDDMPRSQFQSGDAFNRFRMQKSFGIGHLS